MRARPQFHRDSQAGLAPLEIREVDRRNRPERDIHRLGLNVLLQRGVGALDVDYDPVHLGDPADAVHRIQVGLVVRRVPV